MAHHHPVLRSLRQIHGLKLVTSNRLDLDIDQLQPTIAFILLVDIMHICTFLFQIVPLSSNIKHKFSDTEVLNFSENKIEIENTEPILSYYAYYPELFAFDPGFCI